MLEGSNPISYFQIVMKTQTQNKSDNPRYYTQCDYASQFHSKRGYGKKKVWELLEKEIGGHVWSQFKWFENAVNEIFLTAKIVHIVQIGTKEETILLILSKTKNSEGKAILERHELYYDENEIMNIGCSYSYNFIR